MLDCDNLDNEDPDILEMKRVVMLILDKHTVLQQECKVHRTFQKAEHLVDELYK